MCTQAMGLGMKATLISIARQGIFLIPALLILPRAFGLLGLQMAQPIADLCTAIFAFFIVHKVMQELKNRPDVVSTRIFFAALHHRGRRFFYIYDDT